MDQNHSQHVIGLILPSVSNDYCGRLADQLSEQFASHGYRLSISVTGRSIGMERELLHLYADTADGILVVSEAAEYGELESAVPENVPAGFLNRKPAGCPHTSIIESNQLAVFQCILANAASGNDRIALVCANRHLSLSREIIESYKNAMRSTPSGFHEEWIFDTENMAVNPEEFVNQIVNAGCNTIFACTQTLTRQFLDYLLFYNPHAASPVALIGFVNKGTPSKTQLAFDSIHQPLQELTDLAVQQMLHRIQSPAAPVREYLLKASYSSQKVDVVNLTEKNEQGNESL